MDHSPGSADQDRAVAGDVKRLRILCRLASALECLEHVAAFYQQPVQCTPVASITTSCTPNADSQSNNVNRPATVVGKSATCCSRERPSPGPHARGHLLLVHVQRPTSFNAIERIVA
jgi:hypothetical protein